MNITPFPRNSKEYHEFQARRRAAIAAFYEDRANSPARNGYLIYNLTKAAYHAAQAQTKR